MDRNEIKTRYRDKKLEVVLETPLTRIVKWFKFAWNKFVVEWGVPRYTIASVLILNGVGLFWNVVDYWLSHNYGEKTPKTYIGCFQHILDRQLPWNINAFSYIGSFAFWIIIVSIPFVLGFALFSRKK